MSHVPMKSMIGGSAARLSTPERTAAALCHGVFLFTGIPLVAPVLVLVVFSALGRATGYVRSQALQALIFQAALLLVMGLSTAYFVVNTHAGWTLSPFQWADAIASAPGPTGVLLVGLLAVMLVSLFEVVALWQAIRGLPYNLPVVGRWVKE